jgi:hypothetical protein
MWLSAGSAQFSLARDWVFVLIQDIAGTSNLVFISCVYCQAYGIWKLFIGVLGSMLVFGWHVCLLCPYSHWENPELIDTIDSGFVMLLLYFVLLTGPHDFDGFEHVEWVHFTGIDWYNLWRWNDFILHYYYKCTRPTHHVGLQGQTQTRDIPN